MVRAYQKVFDQWCSRRDAMTRIISNSCLINKGIHNSVTQNAFLLFHNGNEEKEDGLISIAAINGKELAKTMPFITEFEFIKALRNNFTECERGNHFDYDIFSSTGMSCCHHPWKGISQLPLISYQLALASNLNTSTMSNEKEMVKSILANGNIEFLRKHSMNLSEMLILKKLNKT